MPADDPRPLRVTAPGQWLGAPVWVAIGIAACTPPPQEAAPRRCPAGHAEAVRDAIYFGLSMPDGTHVSDSAWAAFLSASVTPAFPAGFTVLDGTGQWLDAGGSIVREPSRLVLLLHQPSAGADSLIRAVIARYRTTFHQEAVLWERSATCLTFTE